MLIVLDYKLFIRGIVDKIIILIIGSNSRNNYTCLSRDVDVLKFIDQFVELMEEFIKIDVILLVITK